MIMADGSAVSFTSTDEVTFRVCRTPGPWPPVSPVLFLCSCFYKTAHYAQGMMMFHIQKRFHFYILLTVMINDRCIKIMPKNLH